MLDCELLREVYVNLLDAKEPKFNLSISTPDENTLLSSKNKYTKNCKNF